MTLTQLRSIMERIAELNTPIQQALISVDPI